MSDIESKVVVVRKGIVMLPIGEFINEYWGNEYNFVCFEIEMFFIFDFWYDFYCDFYCMRW